MLCFPRGLPRWLQPADKVFAAGKQAFLRIWHYVFGVVLGLSTRGGEGVTPASLRAGGATTFYL